MWQVADGRWGWKEVGAGQVFKATGFYRQVLKFSSVRNSTRYRSLAVENILSQQCRDHSALSKSIPRGLWPPGQAHKGTGNMVLPSLPLRMSLLWTFGMNLCRVLCARHRNKDSRNAGTGFQGRPPWVPDLSPLFFYLLK
jgi:hypothetical protein